MNDLRDEYRVLKTIQLLKLSRRRFRAKCAVISSMQASQKEKIGAIMDKDRCQIEWLPAFKSGISG
jgi:hypothetical protein